MPAAQRLAALPAAILAAHEAGVRAGQERLKHFWDAGSWLVEAKRLLARENGNSSFGLWLPWLDANFPTVPVRTLQRYARFYKYATVAHLEDPAAAEAAWRAVCNRSDGDEPDDDEPADAGADPGRRPDRRDDPDRYRGEHDHDPPEGKPAGRRKPPTAAQRARQRQRTREAWRAVRDAEATVGLAQRIGLRYDALRKAVGGLHGKGVELLEVLEAHKAEVPAAVWAAATALDGAVGEAVEELEALSEFGQSLRELKADCQEHVRRITPWAPTEGWKEWHARKKARAAGNGDAAK
jgi:hypothetical protein